MAITRQKKEELVQLYKEHIDGSSAIVFTDYRGITVPEIQSLRAKLGEVDSVYMVVKNTLLGIALGESGKASGEDLLEGPNAVVFVGEDIGKGVTALKDWIKGAPDIVEIKGSILDNSVLDVNQTESLSDMPTKEEILAQVLGMLGAPSSSLVRVLNAPITDTVRMINAPQSSLVRVLQARINQLEE